MICCSSYDDLGCLNACDPIDFGTASEDGTYKLLLGFNDNVVEFTVDLLTGANLVFDTLKLNENYYYTAKLILPSGSSSCYKFSTYYSA